MLTGTISEYIGRTSDLLLYDGQQARGDTLLTPALVQPGASGALVTGIMKLVQRFLLELLTKKGTLPYLENRGCQFISDAQSGFWRTPQDVKSSFSLSMLDVRVNLIEEEGETDPSDERFAEAELGTVTVSGDRVSLQIVLTSQAGTDYTIVYPLRISRV